jgi:hypothetical protein
VANALLTPKVYATTALAMLTNELILARMVNQEFKKDFKPGRGNTVYVKRPPEFTVRNGATVAIQDVVEGETPVVIDQQKGVDFQFSDIEEATTVDELLRNRSMQSAMETLAQDIDSAVASRYIDFNNWVGTPGQEVNSFADFALAPKRLDNGSVPKSRRFGVLNPGDHWALAANFSGLNAQTGVANDALQKGRLPMIGGVDGYMSQSLPTHTTGTRTNGTISGTATASSYANVKSTMTQTLALAGLGASGTVKAGDVFTIAGVFAVNPRTKARNDYLQQFVVTTDATADGAGAATVTIAPALIVSGAYQNVSGVGAANAVVTWMGSANTVYSQSLVMRPDAITLASVSPNKPANGEFEFMTDKESGITIRYWRFSDGTNDLHTVRFDVLFGVAVTDRRQGVRLSGTA